MRRDLAERLLTKIMGWSDAEKAAECVALEALANYKYDEYQQYAPGLHFLESLALWLRQFRTKDERKVAYKFVRDRLIFVSEAEMNHLIQLVYPLFIRPYLIDQVSRELKIPSFRVKSITTSQSYKLHLRRTLVLGLSDGARTDVFRRSNWRHISNEQVWYSYDFSEAKAKNLKDELDKDCAILADKANEFIKPTNSSFETVVLLDDFSASGTSFLRESAGGDWKGKIHKILSMIEDSASEHNTLFSQVNVKVLVILYVATPEARSYLNQQFQKRNFERGDIELRVVHNLGEGQKLSSWYDNGILELASNDSYWDPSIDDEHAAVGGSSFRLGYANCALPVVLSHNTPNNSIFLLWAGENSSIHGLFPRVSRHKRFE